MRDDLLQEMRAFAESTRPVSEMQSWWEEKAELVEASFGRFAFLAISKRSFSGLKQVLEREGVEFSPDPACCVNCGEKLFVAEPGVTTLEQIVSFAKRSKLASAADIARTGWIPPGKYCVNGCMCVLWNYR